MNAVETITDEGVDNRDKITLMNEYVKQYVPSLEDNDIGQFAIINGQLYYVGDEDLERDVCVLNCSCLAMERMLNKVNILKI